MSDLIILGGGGHARVVIEVLRRAGQRIAAAVDPDPRLHGHNLDGVPIVGGDDVVSKRKPTDVILVNAIGNRGAVVGDSGLTRRRDAFVSFKARGYHFVSVISPDAVVASTARLDEGCHIITGAIIHPGAQIGANTIINTGAQIDHDCVIGAHCHIAPGAVLCGGVRVGDDVHVGAGAVIIQDITVGAGAVIGAGAVVIKDVAVGATVLGTPGAQRVR